VTDHPNVIRRDDLSRSRDNLVGAEHRLPIAVIFNDSEPGRGPSLHRHPYDEIFVLQEGEATFTIDGEQVRARAGDILVARANQAHGFVNTGSERLQSVNIHMSPRFETEWLEEESG
jgi:mannose-6-phosphate isomerase-like protein (cupin superfamily)